MKEYDVAIIGAGSGGYTAALKLASHGKAVLLIEKERVGGACLIRGCIPSKALIHFADTVHDGDKAGKIGVDFPEPVIDMSRFQEWKDEIISKQENGILAKCKKAGVEILFGSAKLTAGNSISVIANDSSEIIGIKADNIILATGARPRSVPGFEIDEKVIMSSTGLLDLQSIPKSLCVIGGGVIGLELATAMAKLGSRVTIIEVLNDILPFTDTDAKRVIKKGLKGLDIKLMTGTEAEFIQASGEGVSIRIKGSEVSEENFEKILIGVGSRPNIEGLGLDVAGIQLDDDGYVQTDGQLRTSVPDVFAIGDIRGDPMLAHKASMDGIRAVDAILGRADDKEPVIPYILFTEPELATVGITEMEAKEQGLEHAAKRYYFAALGRALANDDAEGFIKLITDADGVIIGGAVVGPDASNLISEITLAVEKGMTVEEVGRMIHPHPTLSEGIWETARYFVE